MATCSMCLLSKGCHCISHGMASVVELLPPAVPLNITQPIPAHAHASRELPTLQSKVAQPDLTIALHRCRDRVERGCRSEVQLMPKLKRKVN